MDSDDQRTAVRDRYGAFAREGEDCCGEVTLEKGYDPDDFEEAPEGANLGLGCGNPVALASLDPGMTVLDLGSGGGFDCFLAAREVAPGGRAIGVDMTPEMVERARENARDSPHDVEFRLGEIEHLPVADGTVDAIISNCVVNLSPDKPRVFAEAFRVLRPGGWLAISDVVATGPVPERVRENPDLVADCVGGAAPIDELEELLADAGFVDVDVTITGEGFDTVERADGGLTEFVSANVEAVKPE